MMYHQPCDYCRVPTFGIIPLCRLCYRNRKIRAVWVAKMLHTLKPFGG